MHQFLRLAAVVYVLAAPLLLIFLLYLRARRASERWTRDREEFLRTEEDSFSSRPLNKVGDAKFSAPAVTRAAYMLMAHGMTS